MGARGGQPARGPVTTSSRWHLQAERQALLVETQSVSHRLLAILLPVCAIGERLLLPANGLVKVTDFGTGRGKSSDIAWSTPACRFAREGCMLDGFLAIAEH